MELCLRAARRGAGRVTPNPLVGAAVVHGGRLAAIGYHARFGGVHAEVAALRKAGRRARGGTLYVTLEPCAHWGKTPPCVDAIIASGVKRVVAAMKDPHPLVDGRGFRALRAAGIAVEVGTLAAPARALNEAYLMATRMDRPFVTLKAGMTLDGRIATAAGESRWITSGASRRIAHRMRATSDAVLVGITTASKDRPSLAPRGVRSWRLPLRVVLDSRLRLDPKAPMLLDGAGGKVVVYHASGSDRSRSRLERAGAEVVRAGRGRGGVDLARVLGDLARRGVHRLLVEGGGDVAWSFLERGAVDRIALFVAPSILGGRGSIPVVGGRGAPRLAESIRISELEVRRVGGDLLITGKVEPRRRGRGSHASR
jgi:diaminohydroxyphosphoribosylaminopyrimidine deaminase/5-amino-6-(5-phosphoribosylamino)uracil reductase